LANREDAASKQGRVGNVLWALARAREPSRTTDTLWNVRCSYYAADYIPLPSHLLDECAIEGERIPDAHGRRFVARAQMLPHKRRENNVIELDIQQPIEATNVWLAEKMVPAWQQANHIMPEEKATLMETERRVGVGKRTCTTPLMFGKGLCVQIAWPSQCASWSNALGRSEMS
jgi:hypothetical protein